VHKLSELSSLERAINRCNVLLENESVTCWYGVLFFSAAHIEITCCTFCWEIFCQLSGRVFLYSIWRFLIRIQTLLNSVFTLCLHLQLPTPPWHHFHDGLESTKSTEISTKSESVLRLMHSVVATVVCSVLWCRHPDFNGWAFTLPAGVPLREKFKEIPAGIDVLITHGPPKGIHKLCSSCARMLAFWIFRSHCWKQLCLLRRVTIVWSVHLCVCRLSCLYTLLKPRKVVLDRVPSAPKGRRNLGSEDQFTPIIIIIIILIIINKFRLTWRKVRKTTRSLTKTCVSHTECLGPSERL